MAVKEKTAALTPLAEEMAYHLAKKKDTPYVKDPVFTENFMSDFSEQLPQWCRGAKFEEVDFSELFLKVDREKRTKEAMSKEQKKSLAAEKKEAREGLKAKFGYATVDGNRVEMANWMVEPPGLFMGRGCVVADTIVKTIRGPKHVEELVPGDMIATHHGSDHMFYKPVASTARQGVRPTHLVRTRTHSIRATSNHPFLALGVKRTCRKDRSGRFSTGRSTATLSWVPLENLRRGDYVVTVRRYQTPGTNKFSNSPSRTFGNTIITPEFARLLGYYIGDGFIPKRKDGSNSGISFSEGRDELVGRYSGICRNVFGVESVVNKHSGGNSQVLSVFSTEFARVFESMGVTGNALTKRVPDWVFGLADDLKLGFLRGYIDADGHFALHEIRGVEYGSFEFESPNRRLIEDFRELAINSGLQVSNVSTRYGHGYTKGQSYRFLISELLSVTRLLDSREFPKGDRMRNYSLRSRLNRFRTKWDWSRLHILDSELFALEKVLEVAPAGKFMTYDVSMVDRREPNFIAGGFVVHNSHPMRGRWKPRVSQQDVILNLDEGSAVPAGDWKEVVHDHDSMWMAKWIDKLTDKEKYIWLHESSPLQQSRNKAKYDNAMKVGKNLDRIREKIEKKLISKDPKERQVATVCYLIDRLGMRVGDEKDEDETDTVGASTLRVEHVKIGNEGVDFDFLGKDSVRWTKSLVTPPPVVLRNLMEFMSKKQPDEEIFHEVTSGMVNDFLSSLVPGVTAKVFRTYHATAEAKHYLGSIDMAKADDLDKLFRAKEANLCAAVFCNHQRTPPKTWEQSLERKTQRLAAARAKAKPNQALIKKLEMELDFYRRTKNYNLNTSMKNYIDPRVYKAWSDYVEIDWSKIYSKSLQKKFAWVTQSGTRWEPEDQELDASASA